MKNYLNQLILGFVFVLSFSNLSAQINFSACDAGLQNTVGGADYTFTIVGVDATGRNIFQTTPVDFTESCPLGVCELQISWNIANNRWELVADDLLDVTPFNGTNLFYYNDSASTPNPPDLSLGVWVDATPGGACGGNGFSVFTGDVQSTLNLSSPPTVATTAATAITGISATLGGNVLDDGGAGVTDRGVVYSSIDTTPEIGEANVTQDSNGNGISSFSESITGLSINTTYYVQAYAINTEGTSYGGVESFTTSSCDVSFSYSSAAYCVDASDPTPTVTGLTGGAFSSTAGLSLNSSTGVVDVSASTPGTYTVTYTTAGTCPNSSSQSVTINALDDASFSYAAAAYCVDDSDPTPTITGLSGGTFSSTAGLSLNASSGVIDVSASMPGTYTVTYTTAGTCPNSSSQSLTINALDDASFSYSATDYCVDASDPTPTVTGLTGGSFTSTAGLSLNASTGAIDVSASTPGTYTVTYTTAGTCPNSSDVDVTINELDDASFSYSEAAYCVSDADPTPTVTGLTGGSFSSTAGLSLNTSTGAIDVSASTPGTYTVTYTTAGTCPNSSDVDLTINELDDASFSYSAADYCADASDPTPTVTGLTGGTFSSTAGLSLDASTGAIDVSASTPGTYTVTYATAGTCPNSSDVDVTINELDDASFSYSAADYCVSDADPTPTVTGLSGGTFSSTAGLSLETSTGAIDVSTSTPGTYTVTYTTAGTCPNSSDVDVTINELDDASFSYSAADYCVDASDPTPTVTGLTGGTFSSTAGLSLDASTGAIDVSASTPGTYSVTYTTAGTCPNSSDVDVTINELDDASFSYSAADYCVDASDPTPTVTGLTGGSFSSTAGLSLDASTGAIDVSASTPGIYTVTYATAGTCPNSSDVDVTINELDDASFSYLGSTYLSTDADPTPTVTGLAGGNFTSTAGLSLDVNSGAIDLSASTPGVYTVTYTTAGTCPNSSGVNVTIIDCGLQASIQTSNASCPGENDGALDLSITGGTAPFNFLWSNGAITEDINNLAPGTYTVTITDDNGCETSASATITVEDTEDPVLDCLSDQTVTLTSDQTEYTLPDYVANGDVSATDNCNVSSISQTPVAGTVLTPGVYTISFTATDDSGNTSNCSFTLTVEETLGTRSNDLGNITLYPNPADQLVIINNAQQHELKEMLVYDIQGRRVMQVELNSSASRITLDVSQLASATYTVVLKSENNQVTRRLIKK